MHRQMFYLQLAVPACNAEGYEADGSSNPVMPYPETDVAIFEA